MPQAFGICNIVLGHGFVLAVHGFVLALMALVPAGAVFDERFEVWMREELEEMRTPHGSVIEALSFCKKDNTFCTMRMANPRAHLWMLMDRCKQYSQFLIQTLPRRGTVVQTRVAFYCDDVKPGNVHRPDSGRTYYAFYLIMLDLPEWFRSTEGAWLDLAYMMHTDVADIKGGLTVVTERLLSAANFPIELRIPGSEVVLVLLFAMIINDEKAVMQMIGVKGASSYKPCLRCKAIFGRLRPPMLGGDPATYMQHYSCCDPRLWDEYSSEGFKDACDAIADFRLAPGTTAAAAKRFESFLGIGYTEGGLLWTPNAISYDIPRCVFWDPMHTVWASGGVAQYEANQFMAQALRLGVCMDTMQSFLRTVSASVTEPKRRLKMSLSKRLVDGDNKHMRAFASEMLFLMPCMVALAELVIAPMGEMEHHISSLKLLYTIQVAVMWGDRSCQFVDLLNDIVDAHHQLFIRLYPRCCKPKMHYLRHLPDLMAQFMKVITCFSAERRHRMSKRIAAYSYTQLHLTMLRGCIARTHSLLQHPAAFECVVLGKVLRRKNLREIWRQLATDHGWVPVRRGRTLRTNVGWLSYLSFVLYQGETPWAAGIIDDIYEATRGGETHFFLVIHQHALVAAPAPDRTLWRYTPTLRRVWVSHTRVLCGVPHLVQHTDVFAILPMYAERLIGAA